MKKYIIVVAGGKGLRMGGDVPKQFIPVKGKPVLMRTLEAFYAYDKCINIILVLPVDQQDYWKRLCAEYGFTLPPSYRQRWRNSFSFCKKRTGLGG